MSDGFDRKPGEHGSPEEEAQHDLECSIYQNYTASEVFVQWFRYIFLNLNRSVERKKEDEKEVRL